MDHLHHQQQQQPFQGYNVQVPLQLQQQQRQQQQISGLAPSMQLNRSHSMPNPDNQNPHYIPPNRGLSGGYSQQNDIVGQGGNITHNMTIQSMYGQRNMSDMVGQGGINNQRALGSDNAIASGGGIQFDAASFPVLSAVGGSNRSGPYSSTAGSGSNQQQSDFSIQKEDFPALSGPNALVAINSKVDSSNMIQGSSSSGFTSYVGGGNLGGSAINRDLTNQNQDPVGSNNHQSSNGLGVPGGMNRTGSIQNQQPSQGLSMAANAGLDIPVSGMGGSPSTKPTESSNISKESKYGLAGLLDVIRMTDRDRNTLALGADLTTFGLNLNSNDCLYSTFTSPFTEQSGSAEPQFTTPSCYLMPPPTLKTDHLAKFQMETLFHMFYSMPRDLLQAVAAQELYRREWRYHSELRLWFKQRNPQELMHGHSNVQFLYFDVTIWEARLFTTAYRGNINQGLLSEEEIKIRQNPSLTSNHLVPP